MTTTVIKDSIGSHVDYIIQLATVADDIPAWGSSPAERDRRIREFWPTEPMLAGALGTTIARYAAFGWSLKGPSRTVSLTQRILHGVDLGRGWISWLTKVAIDLFTQDNGAFIELVRTRNDPDAPVIGINHLDSGQCVRTGKLATPITYYDSHGNGHLLKTHQVAILTEMPSPIESARGMQYCAVTRMLRAAQIMRDISVYKREKISGRFTRAIHLVGGVQSKTIETAIVRAQEDANNQGLIRYLQPVIVASLDPTASVTHAVLELASLPDAFDPSEELKWYVTQLALAFGSDYQDFAPLPGGNLGSSQQSQTLHLKSRGKGPKLFMSLLEHVFNFHGILPATVRFSFGDQDVAEDAEHAELRKIRAEERQIRIQSGEITPEVARQIAVDMGDLDPKYLGAMGSVDLTPDIIVSGTQHASEVSGTNN